MAIIAWMSLVPVLPLGILSLLFEQTPAGPVLLQFGLSEVLVGLYLGVGVMIVGYGIWGMMLQRHSISLVAPFSLLVPVFGAAFGYFFLGETMSLLQLLGTVFLICSVIVIVLPKRVRTPVVSP